MKNKKGKSKNPSKQRARLHNNKPHQKNKLLSVNLSKELRKGYKKRSLRVREGDKVKVLRGNFKGKNGKVSKVDTNKTRVYVDGVEHIKKDGTKIPQHFHPSTLSITSLNLEDKKRKKKLENKK